MSAGIEDITAQGKWPETTAISRKGDSNSNLYCDVIFPVLDERDEDYHLQIQVGAADPQVEQALIDFVARAVDSVPLVLDAMEFALQKLDSVAFLAKEGDTRVAKQSLRNAIDKLRQG